MSLLHIYWFSEYSWAIYLLRMGSDYEQGKHAPCPRVACILGGIWGGSKLSGQAST